MGYGYEADIFDDLIEYRENVITDHLFFNLKNLFMCRFLNLRGSQFIDFIANNLISLEFIDIRNTEIKKLDLTTCQKLKQVIIDEH